MGKARNILLNKSFLDERVNKALKAGFKKQKWVEFCETLLDDGYQLRLYEAKRTLSKYVTVIHKGHHFKVRFSNHRPIKTREADGDCDFFVGVTNFSITNTEDALKAVKQWKEKLNEQDIN